METAAYKVSARKYRPATFRSVVGQDALTNTLKNAIDTGRLAQAYLFCGPRGVGKTSCARIFAKRINCQHPTADGEACGECESCRAFDRGASVNIIELDAASNNGVEAMRSLTEQVNVPPQGGKYRVFIIDEVHMLTTQAFNAFLKTLEEPPGYVVFILATTEKHKVIPTILSRCQIYDFRRITVDDMAQHLAYVARSEGIEAAPEALEIIARKADGAMRDALSIFDQVAASSGGVITYESTIANLNVLDYDYYFRLTEAFAQGDVVQSLLIYKEIRDGGFDSLFFLNGLADHIRNLMVSADARTAPLVEAGKEIAARYHAQAHTLPAQWYYRAMELVNDTDMNYRVTANKQFCVELLMVRLCQILSPAAAPTQAQPLKPVQGAPQTQAPAQSQAQPQPQQQPQQQPQHQAPAQAQPRPRTANLRKPTAVPKLHSAPAPAPAAPAPRPAAQQGSQPQQAAGEQPSEEEVSKAWKQYITDHQEKHNLVTAMMMRLPQRGAEGYEIAAETPKQREDLENELPRLVPFIRKATGCDAFRLSVRMAAPTDKPAHRPMTDREFVREAVAANPSLRDLLTALDVAFA